MKGEGGSNQQPCEGGMDVVEEQRTWGDVTAMEHKINKTGLKQGHLQHLHISKEMPTWHHDGEIPQFPSRE